MQANSAATVTVIDGLSILSAIRGDNTDANLAVIFVTANIAPFNKVGKYSLFAKYEAMNVIPLNSLIPNIIME